MFKKNFFCWCSFTSFFFCSPFDFLLCCRFRIAEMKFFFLLFSFTSIHTLKRAALYTTTFNLGISSSLTSLQIIQYLCPCLVFVCMGCTYVCVFQYGRVESWVQYTVQHTYRHIQTNRRIHPYFEHNPYEWDKWECTIDSVPEPECLIGLTYVRLCGMCVWVNEVGKSLISPLDGSRYVWWLHRAACARYKFFVALFEFIGVVWGTRFFSSCVEDKCDFVYVCVYWLLRLCIHYMLSL